MDNNTSILLLPVFKALEPNSALDTAMRISNTAWTRIGTSQELLFNKIGSNPVLLSLLQDSLARSSIQHLRVNSRCLLYKRLRGKTGARVLQLVLCQDILLSGRQQGLEGRTANTKV